MLPKYNKSDSSAQFPLICKSYSVFFVCSNKYTNIVWVNNFFPENYALYLPDSAAHPLYRRGGEVAERSRGQ